MAEAFCVEIGQIAWEIQAEHSLLAKQCEPYRTDKVPDERIVLTARDIENERRDPAAENASEAYLESLAACRKIADAILSYNGLLFHGSALSLSDRGILFTAPSGTGKSTHSQLWRERFPGEVMMINDDKPFLRVIDGCVYVCGSPWNGKHGLGCNQTVPLQAIVHLQRGLDNRIRPVSAKEFLPVLMQQSYRPKEAAQWMQTLQVLDTIGRNVRFFELACNMDPEAAEVCRRGVI